MQNFQLHRFFYKVERREGRWKLSVFDAIYVRNELLPIIPGQVLRVSPDDLASFRKSYQMLSYVLTMSGYRVNSDLPGVDRSDTVRALEAELFSWAGVQP